MLLLYPTSGKPLKPGSKLICLLLLFIFCLPAWAQSPLLTPDVPDRHQPIYADTSQALSGFPFRTLSPEQPGFVRTAALAAAGAGLWAATYAFLDEPLQQLSQSSRSTTTNAIARTVEPLGRPSNAVSIAGALAVGGLLLKKQKLQRAGLIGMGSVMASAVATNALKNTFHRHRPSATAENHVFDGMVRDNDNTSLPSSHTATAFALATSVATAYKGHKWVPPVAYGVASLVGLSRIHDNAHWATDVVAGAAVGYFTAKGVTYLYDVVNQKLNIRKQRLLLAPQVGLKSGGLNATLVF